MQFDPKYLSALSASISQSSALEATLSSELSSGLRVSSVQIDPTAAAQSSRIGSAIASDDSYLQAASSRQAQLQVTDSTLGEVVTQLTKALSLAVQGNGGIQNTADTKSVADALSGIRDTVLALANTSYTGKYLFSGSQQGSQPFSVNSTTTPATAVYSGDSSMQSIVTPNGQQIQISLPGSSIFGITASGGPGALTALNQLIADFSSGTVSSTAANDIAALTDGLSQVSSQRSVLDHSLSRLQSASGYTQTDEANLKGEQSVLVAADYTTVATQLQSAETQHQALLSVITALGNTNLFSYIK